MAAASSSSSQGGGGEGADPMALVQGYTPEELAIAGEFLTTWLPFLSAGLCPSCVTSLRARVDSLLPRAEESPPRTPLQVDQIEPSGWDSDPVQPQHLPFEASGWDSDPPPPPQQQQQQPAPPAEKPRMSWADMAQEDELAAAAEEDAAAAAASDGAEEGRPKVLLTRDQREQRRFSNLVRNKDFICLERVGGRLVNIAAGLELHAGVFSSAEQKRIVECVYHLQEKGKRGELGVPDPTFIMTAVVPHTMVLSVLVLNGNGADVAKHCVPAVPTKRISITFRKMDPAKRPFGFRDDPELLNLTPLGTVAQEVGRSSGEGKNNVPDIQRTNLSKTSRNKRSKGRTSAVIVGSDILGDQTPGHAQAPVAEMLSVQGLRSQRPLSASSAERDGNSAGRPRELRYQSSAPGMQSQSQVDDTREWPRQLAQERQHGNGMSSRKDGLEFGERRPRAENRQILMINRTINDEMDSPSISSRETGDQPRASLRTFYNKPRRTRVSLDD
ncbi:hypothetical protein U9M48_029927 [Paspalum notatum var. saurae]|uniref:Fe2OG dioxygenase domain-containing protein n=1 Tax=Paspalum notatum var. saurae TaxID=547442 RepID=A0AAQ3X2S4_PASNO